MAFTDVMKKIFPFISVAASAGGPLGTMAASLVGKALGIDKVDATHVQDIVAQAFTSPDQRALLVKAEQDFSLQMAELGYKDAESLAATLETDRADARQRQIALKDKVPAVLAGGITIGFFGTLMLMFFHNVPDAGHDVLLVMIGALGTAWTQVVSYYYGSSAGSDRKSEILGSIAGNGTH